MLSNALIQLQAQYRLPIEKADVGLTTRVPVNHSAQCPAASSTPLLETQIERLSRRPDLGVDDGSKVPVGLGADTIGGSQ